MLAFCLLGTVPLDRVFHLRLLRQVRRMAVSILPVFVVFVLWDLAATHTGHWAFDPEQTLPLRFFGLPVEELGFFVVIPLAGLLTYEAVGVVLARGRARRGRRGGRAGRARSADREPRQVGR
jgi:lycopene cyclase domain-containing protein